MPYTESCGKNFIYSRRQWTSKIRRIYRLSTKKHIWQECSIVEDIETENKKVIISHPCIRLIFGSVHANSIRRFFGGSH